MEEGSAEVGPLPEHPLLREVALAVEEMGRMVNMLDREWRTVYVSSELAGAMGIEVGGAACGYGLSVIERAEQFPEIWEIDPESKRRWWRANVRYMRSTLPPDAPQFADNREAAERLEPAEPPAAWGTWVRYANENLAYSPEGYILCVRLNDPDGEFTGVLELSWPRLPGALTGLLSRGDIAMYERMARMSEPHRCETAIVFADLEASGELSRSLSSRVYFQLIRDFTTAFDEAVIGNDGIVGRHAGDGASAFFCPPDHDESASRAVAAAIRAARQARESVIGLRLGIDTTPAVNFGIHWGSTVMMGQIVTGGRLEVTALGDEVNEAARIQDAARSGTALASKDVVERLTPDDAAAVGIDPDAVSYAQLARIDGVSEKVVRDAGTIPVAEV